MTRRSTALPKSKKYTGLHAVRRASFHLCEDRTASSEAVRDDRHGSAVPEPARTDRCPERDSDRGNGNAAAAVRPWKTTENLLHDTGFGQTADICYFRQRQRLMHFSYVRYLENKIRESFGFRGTPLKFIIRERKEKEQ